MLAKDEMQFAMEDARTRQQSLLSLILFTDQQALTLLSVYVTLGMGAAGVALTALSPTKPIVPPAAGVGLAAAAIMLLVGTLYCFRAMAPAKVAFPGQGADFWIWAAREESVDYELASRTYLERLDESMAMNRAQNAIAANRLTTAKRLGLSTPIVSLVVGVLAFFTGPIFCHL